MSQNHVFVSFPRDLLNSLRFSRTHYGGLPDQLCARELASRDGLSCWNGTDTVKRLVWKVFGIFVRNLVMKANASLVLVHLQGMFV